MNLHIYIHILYIYIVAVCVEVYSFPFIVPQSFLFLLLPLLQDLLEIARGGSSCEVEQMLLDLKSAHADTIKQQRKRDEQRKKRK